MAGGKTGWGSCQDSPVRHVQQIFIAVIQNVTPANTTHNNHTLAIMMTLENFIQKTLFVKIWENVQNLSHGVQSSFVHCLIHICASCMAPHCDGRTDHLYSIRYWWWLISFLLKWAQNRSLSDVATFPSCSASLNDLYVLIIIIDFESGRISCGKSVNICNFIWFGLTL